MTDRYVGRFAPTPSGPLHFGSIVAALGSYLQAKKNHGKWLVRIEDIDTPRIQPGAIEAILGTLERLCLHWDGEILIQSQRISVYTDILQQLEKNGLVYPCICPRRLTKGTPYPGTCRNGVKTNRKSAALRIRVIPESAGFNDRIQGTFTQHLENDVGDFVLKRSDGLVAYHLAVVIDDEMQGITEIVRGCDLLDSTPRQIYLQNILKYKTPAYVHLPIAANEQGLKISKQNHAPGVNVKKGVKALYKALEFLGQRPDILLLDSDIQDVVNWGVEHWDISKVPAQTSIQTDKNFFATSHRRS